MSICRQQELCSTGRAGDSSWHLVAMSAMLLCCHLVAGKSCMQHQVCNQAADTAPQPCCLRGRVGQVPLTLMCVSLQLITLMCL